MATARASAVFPYVVKTPGVCGGKAHIEGTRVRVNNIVFLYKNGDTDAKIRQAYPDIDEAQIHAAIGYYFLHRAEIDAELAEDEAWAKSLE